MAAESRIDSQVALLRNQSLQRQQSLRQNAQSPVSRQSLKASLSLEREDLTLSALTVVVIGASGDLARKKTYPALFHLFREQLIPRHVTIVGMARSALSVDAFRERIGAKFSDQPEAADFLDRCTYEQGAYADGVAYERLASVLERHEAAAAPNQAANRVIYLAIPPSLFGDVASHVDDNLRSPTGWTRLVVEKPFGHDLASFLALSAQLKMFSEDELFRIDHYLGKEMVQSLMVLRFGNSIFEPLWNRQHVANVVITFKEPIDVEGRGGYFDQFGIVRDVMQNHLLQILSLVAMETPVSLSAEDVRDEKTKVLRAIPPIRLDEMVVGQYGTDEAGTQEAYRDHADVPNDSRTPTFATAVLHINNARWRGVPFILKSAKGMNERKAEIRVQFRPAPAGLFAEAPPNELVIRVQPDEAVYLKMMTKLPGLSNDIVQRELDLSYKQRFKGKYMPDAYERLIYDVMRGDHNLFVRDDELLQAWKIFTPVLHQLDDVSNPKCPEPHVYMFGSRGPPESDELLRRNGFVFNDEYQWRAPTPKI